MGSPETRPLAVEVADGGKMKSVVLGVAGKIASGKSTLSTAFAETVGWPHASFGDYVRSVAREQGLDPSNRETLQKIGASLVDRDCEAFCRDVLAEADWKPGQPLVIEGIRHAEVKDALERLVSPSKFVLTYLLV